MPNSPRNNPARKRSYSLWKLGNAGDTADVTVPIQLAYSGIVSVLRHHVTARGSNLAILEVGASDSLDTYVQAGRMFLRQVLGRRGYLEPFVRAIKKRKTDRLTELEVLRRAAADGKGILFCESVDAIDEELRLFADVVAKVPHPSPRQIVAAFRMHGHSLTGAEEKMVSSESWTRLVYAFQPDRPVAVALRRLRETKGCVSPPRTAPAARSGPTLADLNGLGAVKEWGLELAMDLSDFRSGLISWDDVDNGALVSGPPGTGKTLFAEALARTCDIPIVAVSAAQWQTAGYLNDMLKAMRESFGEAQSKGPALLFVDELDAVGSRMINDSRNADYKRQVINGLLELLDGFERRSGVVVLGATNHPENIDPAILRAGRLDRHFFLSLPDAATRRQIFTFHADFSIPEEQEDGFARSTAGMSGADIKQLVRDGRRVARRQGEKFGFEHIVKVATPLLALPSEHMRVAAYHEAGHAIVGVDLGMKLQGISINERVLSVGLDTLGGASFASDPFALKTRSFYCSLIAMYLGGLAAETIIFGEFTDAVANDPRSDLAMATELATRMVACLGMGRTLAIDAVAARDLGRLRAADRRLRMAVDEVLERQFTTATEILEHRGRALCAVAETLLDRKSMSASEVSEILDSYPATCGDAMEGEIGDSVTLKA